MLENSVSRIDDVIARSERVRLPVSARLALEEAAGAVLLAKEVGKKTAKKGSKKVAKKAPAEAPKVAKKSTKKATKKSTKKSTKSERCDRGSQRNPKTGECDPELSEAKGKKKASKKAAPSAPSSAPSAEDAFFGAPEAPAPKAPAPKAEKKAAPAGTRAEEEAPTTLEEKGKKLLKKGKSAVRRLLPKSWEEREAALASVRARAQMSPRARTEQMLDYLDRFSEF